MAKHADPFTPTGPVTRAQLEHYVRGGLEAAERHRIERHLEQDPLLREALEGLRTPGALEGLGRLPRRAPGSSPSASRLLLAGGLIVAGLAGALLWVNEEPVPAPRSAPIAAVPESPFRADSAIAVMEQELVRAEPVPRTQQIGHDIIPVPSPAAIDTVVPEHIATRGDSVPSVAPALTTPSPSPTVPPPLHHGNRRIAYVHDLKLVDPKELYDKGPLVTELGGVPADQPDAETMNARTEAPRTMRYLDFMDVALGKFRRNDHRGCLQDLLFLLGQYPKDINARFYAGLCCYNLGLPDRAKAYLQAVATDPIDTFREEASWYLALSIERADGTEAARPHFERVAAEGGHYAARAIAKLNP